MQRRLFRFVSPAIVASLMVASGCVGSSGGGGAGGAGGGTSNGVAGSGGTLASGGTSGGTSSSANCTNGPTCGGDLAGTWKVTSSCLTLSGDMDVSLANLGCKTVPVTGSLKVEVAGTWTANADGSYADNTTTTGAITFPLSASCLTVSSVPIECSKMGGAFTSLGWAATTTCSSDTSGKCSCSAQANQLGGIGVVSPWASNTGTYTTPVSGLNIDDNIDYSYCVSGNTLTLTSQFAALPMTGTVVLEKTSSLGTGGAGGTGGANAGAGGASTATGGAGGASTGTGGAGGASTATGGAGGAGTATGGAGGASTATGPCDIYQSGGTPCVAAHSTIRALFGAYNGKLYQIRNAAGTTKDISTVSAGGVADAAAQGTFCAGTTCVILIVYDQTTRGNDVYAEYPGGKVGGQKDMKIANAMKESITVGGNKAYSIYTETAMAFWADGSKSGMPLGAEPQGVYMVASGTHTNTGCCFDYGNGETGRTPVSNAAMDAVALSEISLWGTGAGSGPWVMSDLENGLFTQSSLTKNPNAPSMAKSFVTAMEKNNGTTEFAIRGGDATTGGLTTYFKGNLPTGYSPMKKEGAIVLASGGDCCTNVANGAAGTFYEGCIVAGYPSDATEDAVQANIVAAKYSK